MKLQKSFFLELLFLLLLGLTPLLWFRADGFIISGDMLPPLSWEGFVNRFFCWDERLGGGHEAMLHYSVLFFYFVEALFTTFFSSIVAAQKAEFVFWFFLSGLGIYYLLGVLLQGEGRRWGRWVGVLFYLFNLYLEPVWQGMNIANLSAYVFVPILLGLMIEGVEKRRSFWFCVTASSLLTFFLAPVGSNPPMLLACLIPFALYLLLFFFKNRLWREPKAFGRLIAFLALILFFSFWVNLFWIIPFVLQIFVNAAQTSLEFTPGSALGWLEGLSRHTSLFNVAKMQGAWVWYEGFGEPYIPYAKTFQQNPLFIVLGYGLPLLAAIGFVCNREKLAAYFAGALALTGVILGTGIHPPFGKLYAWLVEHLPFFYVVRSPWYKFTLLTCLGYATLWALLGQRLACAPRGTKKRIAATALGGLLLYNLVYAFPISTGRLFFTPSEREFMTHNFMNIPPYVEKGLEYLKEKKGDFRVLDASPKKLQEYQWGNFGFNHPLSSFTLIPVFYTSMVNSPSLYPSDQMVKMLQQAMASKNFSQYVRLLRLFDVEYLIYPYDLHWYEMEDLKEASAVGDFLNRCDELQFEKAFGAWRLYRVKGDLRQPLSAQQKPYFVVGDWQMLPAILNTPSLEKKNFVFISSLTEVLKHPEFCPLSLLLVNMDWEALSVAESVTEYGLGGLGEKQEQLEFEISNREIIEIWIQASGSELLKTDNILLNNQPLSLNKTFLLPGPVLQWGLLYRGELSPGTQRLYLRKPNKEGGIDQVVVVPQNVLQQKREWMKELAQNQKIKPVWLKTLEKGETPFESSFEVDRATTGDELSFELKDQILPKKFEKTLWTADIAFENPSQLEILTQHPGVSYFRSAQGWVFKFLDSVKEGDPSVLVSIKNFAPVSLEEFPYLSLDYKLFDLLSCRASVRFYLLDQEGHPFQLQFPAATQIALLQEVERAFPSHKKVELVGIDLLFSHSFAHRLGYRRYPSKDAILQEIKVERSLEIPSLSQFKKTPLEKGVRVEWKVPKQVRQTNLFVSDIGQEVSSQPTLELKKINPTRYQTQVPASFQGLLVFNQGYHPLWRAQTLEGKEGLHLKLNGWENGYYISTEKPETLLIEFTPQKKIQIGFWVSGSVWILLLLGFLCLSWRQK